MLVPDPGEQAVIAAARDLTASGLSLRKISATLAAHGMVARNVRLFEASQVQQMLA